MSTVVYRIKDIALRLGRSPLTIKRWEDRGLIKEARRDSRGWRIYSEREMTDLIEQARTTEYFKDEKDYGKGAS